MISPPRALSVNDFVQHNILGAVADVVHPLDPFKLIRAFEGFCDAFRFGVLLDECFKHFLCLLVDLFKIILQSIVQTHNADG